MKTLYAIMEPIPWEHDKLITIFDNEEDANLFVSIVGCYIRPIILNELQDILLAVRANDIKEEEDLLPIRLNLVKIINGQDDRSGNNYQSFPKYTIVSTKPGIEVILV